MNIDIEAIKGLINVAKEMERDLEIEIKTNGEMSISYTIPITYSSTYTTVLNEEK